MSVNDLIKTFVADEGELLNKERFFVIGRGKSGTTWLARVFHEHPQSAFMGERRLLEDTDGNYRLLESFINYEQFMGWFKFSSYGIVHPNNPEVRYELARVVSDYLYLKSWRLRKKKLDGITHIGEKIAITRKDDAIRVMEELHHLYPNARLVHVVRDGRDVAVSQLFHIYRNQKKSGRVDRALLKYVESVNAGKPKSSHFAKKYFLESARDWAAVVREIDLLGLQIYGDRYKLIRYEDMLDDFDSALRDVFEFVGLSFSHELLEKIRTNTSFEKLSEGRKQGEQDSKSFFRKGVSGDWKNAIPESEKGSFVNEAGDMLSRFEYI